MSFFWFGGPPPPPRPGDKPHLAEKFGIEGENKSRVNQLEREHHKEKRTLIQKDRELHVKLYENLGRNDSIANVYLDKINHNKMEIEQMTYAFFDTISTYCNDTQKAALRQFCQEGLRDMLGVRGPKPRR